MNHCESCGLPEWAVSGEGLPVTITVKAENRFKRDSTKTVWACSEECAVQIYGISKYGKLTSKWPVTRAQLRAIYRKMASATSEVKKVAVTKPNSSRKASQSRRRSNK